MLVHLVFYLVHCLGESSRKISDVSILYKINGGHEVQGTLVMCISCSDRVDRNQGIEEIQEVLQIWVYHFHLSKD